MNDLESNDLKLNSLEIFGSESNEFEYYGFTEIKNNLNDFKTL